MSRRLAALAIGNAKYVEADELKERLGSGLEI